MKKVVLLTGGLGRQICAIPAIEKLAQNNEVIVISAFRDIFKHNPHILKTYFDDQPNLWQDVIQDNELLSPEPYLHYLYYTQKHHLIQSFNFLLNNSEDLVRPNLYFSDEDLLWGKQQIKDLRQYGKKLIIFQPFSATAQDLRVQHNCSIIPPNELHNLVSSSNDEIVDNTYRSMPMSLINYIADTSDGLLLNFSTIHINHPNILNLKFTYWEWIILVNMADECIGIDSSLIHIAYALNKPGVFYFGSSYQQNLGYPTFKIIQKPGYPKCYAPIRIVNPSEYYEKNKDAMVGLELLGK